MEKSIFTPEQEVLQHLLRQTRLAAGLTQEGLAEHLGEPQSFVSKYESGERRLDLIELRRIGLAMGVSLLELVTRFEDRLTCSQTPASAASLRSSGRTSG